MRLVSPYPVVVLGRRGVVVLGLVLAGCSGDSNATSDAAGGGGPGSSGCPCAEPPAGIPACGQQCGNNQIDTCYGNSPMGCHCVVITEELCDGDTRDCRQWGYYANNAACNSQCFDFDRRSCDACPPTGRCETFPDLGMRGGAMSGTLLAVASSNAVTIFDGLTKVHDVPITSVYGIVDVPSGGWLVRAGSPPGLSTLDSAGVRGTAHSIPQEMQGARMAAAGDRVLLAWTAQLSSGWHVAVAIADTSGNIVVPAATILDGVSQYVEVTSDGTGFFVASDGRLARVAPDGTSTVVTGFPASQARPHLVWSGSMGWYVTDTSLTGFVAQRFDATGAKVGTAIPFDLGATSVELTGDGADLVAARFASARLGLVRIDATGTVGADTEVGGGEGGVSYIGHRGSDFVVAWERPENFQLALVAR
jgi:hypothetical protein